MSITDCDDSLDSGAELLGVDFSSAPSRSKPIVCAHGSLRGKRLRLTHWTLCEDLRQFDRLLARPGPWLGGFDLPFGLPRELVLALGWPLDWLGAMQRFFACDRADLRARFKAFCDARPRGAKFAHRATDRPAGSSPSMKWVNPPVAWMMHAGVPRLLAAGVSLPGLHRQGSDRLALEAYPALLARAVIARRSYKSDARSSIDDPLRRRARGAILRALEQGSLVDIPILELSRSVRRDALEDGRGDRLDALLCLVQAGWAWQRRAAQFGRPPDSDPLEGWIVGAGLIGALRDRQSSRI